MLLCPIILTIVLASSYIYIDDETEGNKGSVTDEEKEQEEGLNAAELIALDTPASAFVNASTLIETLYIYNDTISALLVALDLEEIQLAD